MRFEELYLQDVNSGAMLEYSVSADRVMLWRSYNGTWFEYCYIQRRAFDIDWHRTGWNTCGAENLPPSSAKPIH